MGQRREVCRSIERTPNQATTAVSTIVTGMNPRPSRSADAPEWNYPLNSPPSMGDQTTWPASGPPIRRLIGMRTMDARFVSWFTR